MLSRREWIAGLSSAVVLRGAEMSATERVDRALRGEDTDRPPFSFWHHFLDQTKSPESHAQSTLAYHDAFHTDLVKVMSDYPYPKPAGAWFEPKVEVNPFPREIRALELIRDGLKGKAYFVETIFNPWNVAEKLSSKEAVARMMHEKPQTLLDALEAIAKSEANHARRAVQAGASGIFLAIANAQGKVMTEAEYAKFSEPFDKMVLEAVRGARLNVLHLHTDAKYGDKLYIDRFYQGWPAAAINYSLYTDIPVSALRKNYAGVIMAGLDERRFRGLTVEELRKESKSAQAAAGKKFILAPGCSVPNDTTEAESLKVLKAVT